MFLHSFSQSERSLAYSDEIGSEDLILSQWNNPYSLQSDTSLALSEDLFSDQSMAQISHINDFPYLRNINNDQSMDQSMEPYCPPMEVQLEEQHLQDLSRNEVPLVFQTENPETTQYWDKLFLKNEPQTAADDQKAGKRVKKAGPTPEEILQYLLEPLPPQFRTREEYLLAKIPPGSDIPKCPYKGCEYQKCRNETIKHLLGVHVKPLDYVCGSCTRLYNTSKYLKEHIRKSHPNKVIADAFAPEKS